ncbi:hypothetical protein ACHAWO_013926 [Cyclotella atomus]|uniref:J domain-containing protein n=1 Tax=Cyclotella atomus TaxID=382360 RepID=A0ABD3PN31_9STRA
MPNRSSAGGRKDPYEVLGIQRGASSSDIKSAYRRLAMKNHPDRVQGVDAKKAATAKFAEISAAYELLTTSGDVGASHPSFAGEAGDAPRYDAERNVNVPRSQFGGFNQQPFTSSFSPATAMDFDPFGFGTFDSFHFTDPFELFRRTFGEAVFGNDVPFASPFGASPFLMQQRSMGMNSGFGGFPSMFNSMISGELAGSNGFGTTTFSSSSYSFGGSGAGSSGGRIISTTTTTVNGKTVTRTEQTVIKPDGSRKTVIDLTGDDVEEKIPAICVDDTRRIQQQTDENPCKKGRHKSAAGSSSRKTRQTNKGSFSAPEQPAPRTTETPKSKHPRRYKVVSKEKIEHQQSNQESTAACNDRSTLLKSHLSENETYVTDENNASKPETETTANATSATNGSTALKRNKQTEPTTPQQRGRKRKFCDLMYRCLICCFPPCKRRRVTNDNCH